MVRRWSPVLLFALICISPKALIGQNVHVKNKGLEDKPRMGLTEDLIRLARPAFVWTDCGLFDFPDESAHDVHPGPDGGFWQVTMPAYEGDTYVGLVVRENETWESIAQELDAALRAGQCYQWKIAMAQSEKHLSMTTEEAIEVNFDGPTVLRLWGGSHICSRGQLLAESDPVDHTDWKVYTFDVEPTADYQWIRIEAYYKVPTLQPYNGHILIDAVSDFEAVDCSN